MAEPGSKLICRELPMLEVVEKDMLRTLFLLVVFTASLNTEAKPHWRWEDRFSGSEKAALQDWVLHAEKGLTTLVGPLPYAYRVHFHRMTRGKGPTPWANTDKRRGRAVHYHVNTAYAWRTFKKRLDCIS